ncbi:hypothetical protein H0H81_001050 [Sphagnurus paluster]|uniref:Uncharacterized protein n=1 Tax=Sphagnurus paluster TaxID=117069 RepID=A0A9P7FMS6_9AGAR|nr:hypothetical protein H0H81_001050 [Sphagnurus paluster]
MTKTGPDNIMNDLRESISAQNLQKTQDLLDDWDSRSPFPSTTGELLPFAVTNGSVEIISLLLQRNKGPVYFTDAILAALQHKRDISMFQAFLDGGFDINDNLGHMGDLLFLSVRHLPVLEWALNHGADPNRSRSGMRTALDSAVMCGSADAVRLLLQHGARLHNTNALKVAAYYGQTSMIELLLEAGADVNEVPDYKEMLRAERVDGLGTALHEAANGGQREAAVLLLQRGADPNIKDSLGKSALDIARQKGHAAVAEVLERAE